MKLGHCSPPGINYINTFLEKLDEATEVFWGEFGRLAEGLVAQATDELKVRFQHKVSQSQSRFTHLFGRMSEAEGAAAIATMESSPILFGLVEKTTCPACDSCAWIEGQEHDFSPEGECFTLQWFAPRAFACRLCTLKLEGRELEVAGIIGHIIWPGEEAPGYWLPTPP